ncbi:phage tail protein [Mesobacillus foraminis]|uniref:Phage-related protein n=1 Tax=Mesobacillus foraminis TaxID=279826 RepID=A0A4V2RDM9_9BACI|nr:hypothetical protein [Mesobacillus foraminis]TCN25480.1 hypothetical protein EV146_105137 [Mesobacillus foraminis]
MAAQTIADLLVEIGIDTSGLEQGAKEAEKTVQGMGSTVSGMAKEMGDNVQGFSDKWGMMSNEMKTAYTSAKSVLDPFKKDLIEVEYGYFKMAQGMSTYKGSTDDFMSAIGEMGKRQKKINDEMIKSNDFMKQSFIEGIGAMMARSSQSDKIAANFDRMNNPLYRVNNGLLKISAGLDGIAKKGTPAYLALKQLGTGANMKDLQEHMRLINGGLLRFQSLALVAAVGAAIFYGALHEGAKSVPGYTESFEGMLSSLREAFQPMVEVFAAVMSKVYDFITAVANLIIKFNEAHPMLAKLIQGFLMLIPALILILSPLAIGIGLFGGLAAAWAALAPLVMPLVTGFMSVFGTVLLVAGVIALLAAGFYLLWTRCEWFRNGLITAWEMIKSATQTAWNFILNSVLLPIWNAIVAFAQQIFGKFQQFWAENGAQIMEIVNTYMTAVKQQIQQGMEFIKGIFQIVWPIIQGIVKIAWNLIKTIINTGLDIILGLIDAAMSLLQGDWRGAWDAIKGIAEDIWHNIESFFENIDLLQIGKDIIQGLINGIGSMAGAVADRVASIANLIPDGLKSFLGIHSPSRLIRDQVGKWIPLGLAEGIDDNSGSVEKSAMNLAKSSIPSVSDIEMGAKLTTRSVSIPDENRVSTMNGTDPNGGNTFNFERLLEGAIFNVREEADIKKIAKEFYNYSRMAARSKGVVMP